MDISQEELTLALGGSGVGAILAKKILAYNNPRFTKTVLHKYNRHQHFVNYIRKNITSDSYVRHLATLMTRSLRTFGTDLRTDDPEIEMHFRGVLIEKIRDSLVRPTTVVLRSGTRMRRSKAEAKGLIKKGS